MDRWFDADLDKREEIRKSIAEDLKHIPQGNAGDGQTLLRRQYSKTRTRDLGNTSARSRRDSLLEAIESVRNLHEDFGGDYDRKYFREV